jgi:hypothetical protein
MDNILQQIKDERAYQNSRWGNAFDDKNTTNDWVTYICQRAACAAPLGKDDGSSRRFLVQVAALAVAAIEAHDRNNGFPKRHYD